MTDVMTLAGVRRIRADYEKYGIIPTSYQDEIAPLLAAVERLHEVLKPFSAWGAAFAEAHADEPDDRDAVCAYCFGEARVMSLGDVRRARALLAELEGE